MKKTLCAIALSLSLSPTQASVVQQHEKFEQEIKSTLAPFSGKSIAGLKVIYLGADIGPWLDTGMSVQPGDQVSLLLNGKVWLSRHYDISLEAPIQVWRRIGPEGKISRGQQATDTLVAEQGGTIQLKNLPTRWLNTQGAYQGDPAPFNPDAGGGISVAVIRWAPGTDVAAELAKLAGRENSPAWSKAEAKRLKTASRQPAGWQYLWELGPADIFSEQHADSRDGGPSHRIDAHTNNDVAILQKEVDLPLNAETALQWSWKVGKLPALAAETSAVSHDYLSIAVEFENGKDLTYLWSRELPVGLSFPCPLEGWKDRETHIVARSGTGDLGKWLNESHNVLADYEKAIGGPAPGRIVRVWLIANSVFGRGEGHAQFGNIQLNDGPATRAIW